MHDEFCPQELRKDIGDAHRFPCTCGYQIGDVRPGDGAILCRGWEWFGGGTIWIKRRNAEKAQAHGWVLLDPPPTRDYLWDTPDSLVMVHRL